MDANWFVFLGNRHEGPYTRDEIKHLLDIGSANATDFVWKEGMADWEVMNQVAEFGSPKSVSQDLTAAKTIRRPPIPQVKVKPWYSRNYWAYLLLFIFALFAAQRVYRANSSLPAYLGDVSETDQRELRAVQSRPLRNSGPGVAVAFSTADVASPSFYLATNLPAGARFELYFVGVRGTLVGRNSVSGVASISVAEGGLIKTPPIRLTTGESLPRGLYRIFVVEAGAQPPAVSAVLKPLPSQTPLDLPAEMSPEISQALKACKVFARKTVFFGGASDQYQAREQHKHELELHEKGKNELMEVKQYAATIEDQLNQTDEKFQTALNQKQPDPVVLKNQWQNFHRGWIDLQKHLDETFQGWSAELSADNFVYGELYGLTRETHEAVNRMHQQQGSYFEAQGGADARKTSELEVQIAETTSLARSMVLSLKAKTALAEKLAAARQEVPN